MKSLLIQDTTQEERQKIVEEALGFLGFSGTESGGRALQLAPREASSASEGQHLPDKVLYRRRLCHPGRLVLGAWRLLLPAVFLGRGNGSGAEIPGSRR